MAGNYSYKNESGHNYVNKFLKLEKDSTFECAENYHEEPAEDVGAPVYRYIGKGRYTVNKKELVLNFDAKFRKIYKIEVVPLTAEEITDIRKNNSGIAQISEGKYILAVNIYFKNFSFEHERFDSSIGLIKVNDLWIGSMRNNYMAFPASNFPYEIMFDFEKFTGQRIADYSGYTSGTSTLGFNFGFFDERIRIGKPGNYKINIYPFKEDIYSENDQVFTGKRTYPISNVLGAKKIGDMRKN